MKRSEQIEAYEQYGDYREELSALARGLLAKEGPRGIASRRFRAPGKMGAPTNDDKLAGMEEKKFLALLELQDPKTTGGALKASDLDKVTFASMYETVMFPFIYIFRLPALADARVKKFSGHAAIWVGRYCPNGLPILDHLALISTALAGLWDCFVRKAKWIASGGKAGDPPQFPGKEDRLLVEEWGKRAKTDGE